MVCTLFEKVDLTAGDQVIEKYMFNIPIDFFITISLISDLNYITKLQIDP